MRTDNRLGRHVEAISQRSRIMKVVSLVRQSHHYPGQVISNNRPRFVFISLLSLLIMACGPLTRLTQIIRVNGSPATKVAVISKPSPVAADAYAKIETLPGYRLERHYSVIDDRGQYRHHSFVSQVDSSGNKHILIQTAGERRTELYVVDGHTFGFEEQYEGWVEFGASSPPSIKRDHELFQDPAQLLHQYGIEPTKATPDTLNGRSVTRYTLQQIISEMAAAFEQAPSKMAVNLSGTLWIDDQTGALLKSEIILYDGETGRSQQEFRLEINDIGDVATINRPKPVIDPVVVAAATATAQAWTPLTVEVNYQGTPLSFELIPLQARQLPNSSPRSTEVYLLLRQMPGHIFQEANLEPFLAQLRQQLTLSIPERNLIVTSSGYYLESSDVERITLRVRYSFNADLEDFDHVELIVSGQGNPQFAPLPVE